MKTAYKFLTGLFLASSMMVGCGANGAINYHSSETTTTTDANGNTTTTTTSNDNGNVQSTSYSGYKKDITFANATDEVITKLEIKTNLDSDYSDLLNGEVIHNGYERTLADCTLNNDVKTLSFRITTEAGYTVEIKDLDVKDMKSIDKPILEFTQNGNTMSVALEE